MDFRAFLRQHVAGRPMIIGGLAAMIAGLQFGSYLKAGDLFQRAPSPQVYIPAATTTSPEAISFLMDADGRIPDYVIGADSRIPFDPLPMVRTAWEEPPPAEQPIDLPWRVDEPIAEPRPARLTSPPSISGDILAIETPVDETPLG